MTRKQLSDGLRLHRDWIVVAGLVLNLGAVLVTSGVLYGRVDAVLDRAVQDIAEVRTELKHETESRVAADLDLRREIVEGDRRIEERLRASRAADLPTTTTAGL